MGNARQNQQQRLQNFNRKIAKSAQEKPTTLSQAMNSGKGLLSDQERGAVSPIGGVAKTEKR
jgi:hypothetical protein